jgi:hypothetical protein
LVEAPIHREIADLRHFSPRIYAMFGWFALAFVVITIANLAKLIGFGMWVTALGNLLFITLSVFTMVGLGRTPHRAGGRGGVPGQAPGPQSSADGRAAGRVSTAALPAGCRTSHNGDALINLSVLP